MSRVIVTLASQHRRPDMLDCVCGEDAMHITEQKLEAEKGQLLSEILMQHDIHIDTPCAGRGVCKKCTVVVNGIECLACQTRVDEDMYVEFEGSAELENIAVAVNTEAGDYKNTKTTADKMNPVPDNKNQMYSHYGIAADLGTTTICMSLMTSGGRIDTVSRKNPQTRFGADVINRIQKYMEGEALDECVRAEIAEMILELCQKNDILLKSVDAMVITGNTAMLYLLAGQNPEALSHAPFTADRLFGEYLKTENLGFPLKNDTEIYLPRCVSAFVGGDTMTAVTASGMCMQDDTALLVDIGTNGEIALYRDNNLVCCSTAAGPAFEGAGISCGVYGIKGAIDHVWQENQKVCYSTIGNIPPVGICGSGIIDAVAVMLERGIIDETGAFTEDEDFYPIHNNIGITAQDVRQIQLAKSAVRAGIETLLDITEKSAEDIKVFYIAGGFGSFVNLKNAAQIGLIPSRLLHCAKTIGNAAHSGAEMLLQNRNFAELSYKMALEAETIALDANPVFAEHYMTYMMFEQE